MDSHEDQIYKKCAILQGCLGLQVEYTGDSSGFLLNDLNLPGFISLKTGEKSDFKEQLKESRNILIYTDQFKFKYIIYQDKKNELVILGPYLDQDTESTLVIERYILDNNLSLNIRDEMKPIYNNLKVLSENQEYSIVKLLEHLFYYPLNHKVEIIFAQQNTSETNIPDTIEMINKSISTRELSYDFENRIISAISRGNEEEALHLLFEGLDKDYSHKMSGIRTARDEDKLFISPDGKKNLDISLYLPSNPLRISKNMLIVANTNYRRGVISAGVNHIYADNISTNYMQQIENATTIDSLSHINRKMIKEYCTAVKHYETSGYSAGIRKVIQYIHIHLSEPLTLSILSDIFSMNPSYLSRLFKKETSMTLTDFIHNTRIKEAKRLFERGHTSVMDVSILLGYDDPSYFSRIFKKMTSISPTDYIKSLTI